MLRQVYLLHVSDPLILSALLFKEEIVVMLDVFLDFKALMLQVGSLIQKIFSLKVMFNLEQL